MILRDVRNVIVQAGGVGSRMGPHTANKPKCLLSISGRPLLYRLFDRFPRAHFYILTDHKEGVLSQYLKTFAPVVNHTLVSCEGKGTCSGMSGALEHLSADEPLVISWSDLLLDPADLECEVTEDTIFTASNTECRWSVNGSTIQHIPSSHKGIVGLFYFSSKTTLKNLPTSGEFVKFLSVLADNSSRSWDLKDFQVKNLSNVYEFRDIEELNKWNRNKMNTRFFNDLRIEGDKVIKTPVDPEFAHLIGREIDWYKKCRSLNINFIPEVHKESPFTLQKINGCNVFDKKLNNVEKETLVSQIVSKLQKLHSSGPQPMDVDEVRLVYISKTIDRVNSIKNLIPNFNRQYFKINGQLCKNIFSDKFFTEFESIYSFLLKSLDNFSFIHGDCTFSNLLVDDRNEVWFIDPRGYFGDKQYFGDRRYDYAKLFYSINGNYDQFNQRNFTLDLGEEINITIKSNEYEFLSDFMLDICGTDAKEIRILHALIWISLSGYVRDDYDSILASFFNGLYLLENA